MYFSAYMGAQESSNKKKVEQIDIGEEYSKKSGAYRIWTHINPCTKNKKTQGLFKRLASFSCEF